MRHIDTIVIHHSATGPEITRDDIDRMHKERGYSEIGYHFVVYPDGEIVEGRPVEKMGAHAKGANKGSVGVCLVGRFDGDRDPPPVQQWAVATAFVAGLCRRYGVIRRNVLGHNEAGTTATACPGFDPEGFRDALQGVP